MEDALSYLFFISIAFAFVIFIAVLIGLDKNKTTNTTNRTNDNEDNSSEKRRLFTEMFFPNIERDIDRVNTLLEEAANSNTLYETVDRIYDIYHSSAIIKETTKIDLTLECNSEKCVMEKALAEILLERTKEITLLEIKYLYNYKEKLEDQKLSSMLELYTFLMLKAGNKAINEYKKLLSNNEEDAINCLENYIDLRPAYSAAYDVLQPYYERKGLISKVISLQNIKQEAFRAENARVVASFLEKEPSLYETAIMYLYREKSILYGWNERIELYQTKTMAIGDVLKKIGDKYKYSFDYFCNLKEGDKKKESTKTFIKVESSYPSKEPSPEIIGHTNEISMYNDLVNMPIVRISDRYLKNEYYQKKDIYNYVKEVCFSYIDRSESMDVLKKLYSCLMFCDQWFDYFEILFKLRRVEIDMSQYYNFNHMDVYTMLNKNIVRLSEKKYKGYSINIKGVKDTKEQDSLTIEIFNFLEQAKSEIRNNNRMNDYFEELNYINNKAEDIYSTLIN